ncbi:ABC transporter substrate-binding protein [Nakamurella lactea]|uniref:ABC transporter substrate-binding protein n=1 Tax=Nakamurella lactea TaxID=459515 RepID=UPI000413E31D|nr:ABC transporter substrate-binding protein [Nakamurella lactea]
MRSSHRLLPVLLTAGIIVTACGGSDSGSSPTGTASQAGDSGAGTTAPASPDASGPSGSDAAETSGTAEASGSGAPGAGSGGTLTLGLANDPGNLDPSMTVLSVTRSISHLAYDTLINQSTDGSFVSGLATSWKVKPDSIEFTLNPDVTCSDGSKLTTEDVKANIDFLSDPKNKSPLLGVMLPPGLTTEADTAKHTVTVTSPAPNAFLLNGFAGVFMVCNAGLADHKKLAQKTIGTGPFVLSEAVADDHYTYTRNEKYAWGPGGKPMEGPGVPDTVNARIITNPTTLANLLISGEVNGGTVIGADTARLDAAGLKKVDVKAPLGEFFFNQDKGRPGADPAVREALITALNREALTKVGTAGKGAASTGLVTIDPRPCGTDTVTGHLPDYDLAKAKQILDNAGWAPGADGIRAKNGTPLQFTFIYPQAGGDSMAAAAELVGQMWKELGVGTKLQSVTSTQLNEVAFGTGAWDAGWVPVTVNLPSQLAPFLSGAVPPDGTNFSHLANATYDQDSKKALATGDVKAACALWDSAETALFTAFDVIPMFDTSNAMYLNKATVNLVGGELDAPSLRLTAG